MVMSVWLAAVLVAVATLAGSWLARRSSMKVSVGLAIASALMLVTALGEIVPDAVDDAIEQNVPLWVIGLSIVFGFVVITYFTREGCAHDHTKESARHAAGVHRRVKAVATAALFGGTGTAVALAVHRAIEGATLTLTGASAVVLLALLVHSVSEGLALTAMLDLAGKKVGFWMFLACLSPAAGILVAETSPVPPEATPILLGTVAGVLLRTAIVGFRLAGGESGRLPRRAALAAGGVAAALAATLAVAQWLPAPAGEATAQVAAMIRRPITVPMPIPEPSPDFTPKDRTQLRWALTTGRLSLAEILARTDRLTKHTSIWWLLRGRLNGRDLTAHGIGESSTVGDLTGPQRSYLVDAVARKG